MAVIGIVKFVGSEVPPAQAGFLRYLLGIVFLVPMLRPIIKAKLGIRDMPIICYRGMVHAIAVLLWFYAMTKIPMAEVTAMNYLAPVYITVGAAFFFGERLATRRIAAVSAALVGALIILRPGFREISPGHLAMLAAAVAFAASYLFAKRLTDRLEVSVVVGMLSITVPIAMLPFALAVWVPPTSAQLFWLFLVALFATAGHYTMTLAFRSAPISVTQPITFLQLVWSVLLGFFVFGEGLDGWVIVGGAAIIAAASFIAFREAQLAKRQNQKSSNP